MSSPDFLINSQQAYCRLWNSSCHIVDLVFQINPGHHRMLWLKETSFSEWSLEILYHYFVKTMDVRVALPAPACSRNHQVFRAKPRIILGRQQKAATTSVQARKHSDKKLFQNTSGEGDAAQGGSPLLNLHQHICKSHPRAPALGPMTDRLPVLYRSAPLFIASTQGLPPTCPNTITSHLLIDSVFDGQVN